MWRNFFTWEMWTQICFVTIHAILLQTKFCCNLRCFVAESIFLAIYALLRGEKLNQKLCLWRKKVKCLVWCWYTNTTGQCPICVPARPGKSLRRIWGNRSRSFEGGSAGNGRRLPPPPPPISAAAPHGCSWPAKQWDMASWLTNVGFPSTDLKFSTFSIWTSHYQGN